MEAFFASLGLVALAEVGDKTQLLAFTLAARFRKPAPILAGILLATLANHTLAGTFGAWIASQLTDPWRRWTVAAAFIAFGLWALVPDRPERFEVRSHRGVLVTTMIAFFLVEMGDKTQLATVALAARFQPLAAIIAGTTSGMLIADAPAVWIGERLGRIVSFRIVRYAAAGVFFLTALISLL